MEAHGLMKFFKTLLSKLEKIQAKDALESEEKLNIWDNPELDRAEQEKAIKEKIEVIIQLLMIHYLLSKHQDTDEKPITDETVKGKNEEAAIQAINSEAEGEEITLKFS